MMEAGSAPGDLGVECANRIRNRVLETLEEKGLGPPVDSPSGRYDHCRQLGSSIRDTLQARGIPGPPGVPGFARAEHPELHRNLPNLLAFGHSIASLFHRLFDGPLESTEVVQRTGSLFNATICSVDRIWDVEQEHRALLEGRITGDKVTTALTAPSLDSPVFSQGLGRGTALLPTFTCWALDAYVSNIRRLLRRSAFEKFARRALSVSIVRLLQGHARSAQIQIEDSRPEVEVSETLREVGSGPFRVIAQASILTLTECDESTWTELSEESLRIGDIFRWIDDLDDLVEDIMRRRWNSAWLDFVERGGEMRDEQGHLRHTQELLCEFRDLGIAESVAKRIVRRASILDQTGKEEVSYWIWRWLS